MDIISPDKADLSSTDLEAKLHKALEAEENLETEPFQLNTPQGQKSMTIQGQVVRQGKKDHSCRILLQFKEAWPDMLFAHALDIEGNVHDPQ